MRAYARASSMIVGHPHLARRAISRTRMAPPPYCGMNAITNPSCRTLKSPTRNSATSGARMSSARAGAIRRIVRTMPTSSATLVRGPVGLGALHALKRSAEEAATALCGHDPGPHLPRRIVAHVLRMSAFEIGHPVLLNVLMKADDATWQRRAVGESYSHFSRLLIGTLSATGVPSCSSRSSRRVLCPSLSSDGSAL